MTQEQKDKCQKAYDILEEVSIELRKEINKEELKIPLDESKLEEMQNEIDNIDDSMSYISDCFILE